MARDSKITNQGYQFLDSGKGMRLERFGKSIVCRPCNQAIWPQSDPSSWEQARTYFSRSSSGKGHWEGEPLAGEIELLFEGQKLTFELRPNAYGNIGFFPDHDAFLRNFLPAAVTKGHRILNLFAYTGLATLFAAKRGAAVTHVDASKVAVDQAKVNLEKNALAEAPVRWILDDVLKFVGREKRRGQIYDGIIVDPPTFGHGPKNEPWQIDLHLPELLALLPALLSPEGFVLLSSHSPQHTPLFLQTLTQYYFDSKMFQTRAGELYLTGSINRHKLPVGSYLCATRCASLTTSQQAFSLMGPV